MNPEPLQSTEAIFLDLAEAEVLRLVDLEGLYQEQAGSVMGLSRGTVWRILESARRKVVRSIYEGRCLMIAVSDEVDDRT
jgi:predicted DNA-binding protein (UPF0251 family)